MGWNIVETDGEFKRIFTKHLVRYTSRPWKSPCSFQGEVNFDALQREIHNVTQEKDVIGPWIPIVGPNQQVLHFPLRLRSSQRKRRIHVLLSAVTNLTIDAKYDAIVPIGPLPRYKAYGHMWDDTIVNVCVVTLVGLILYKKRTVKQVIVFAFIMLMGLSPYWFGNWYYAP